MVIISQGPFREDRPVAWFGGEYAKHMCAQEGDSAIALFIGAVQPADGAQSSGADVRIRTSGSTLSRRCRRDLDDTRWQPARRLRADPAVWPDEDAPGSDLTLMGRPHTNNALLGTVVEVALAAYCAQRVTSLAWSVGQAHSDHVSRSDERKQDANAMVRKHVT